MTAPLPHGEEKARAVRSMFDRVAARYDLVNRVMTFGLDVGWRRRTVERPAAAGRRTRVDSRAGPATCATSSSARDYRPVGVDFSLGMLGARDDDRARSSRRTRIRLPFADASVDGATCGFALRNVTDLETFFGGDPTGAPAGGRVALLETAEPEGRVMRAGHSVYFGRSFRWSAARCPIARRTPTSHARWRTCPRPTSSSRCSGRPGSPDAA